MKNAIISILALFLVYFILNALGVFNFGSIIDHSDRSVIAKERLKAVMLSDTFNIGVLGNSSEKPMEKAMNGISAAVEDINAKGGILGKQVNIIFCNATNSTTHNAALQELVDRRDIALCIGPFNSDYIPSMRALSQYGALPLVSVLTIFSDSLAELEEENFITFFPSITSLTHSISEDIKMNEFKSTLLISPDENTYGHIFANSIERVNQTEHTIEGIYRLNYQSPFRKDSFSQVLSRKAGENAWDAIIFCGLIKDFFEFCSLAKELDLDATLYGSDDLDSQELLDNAYLLPSNLRLPYAIYEKNKSDDYTQYLGIITMEAIADVLKDGYDPKTLISSLYEYQDSQVYKGKNVYQVKIKEVEISD